MKTFRRRALTADASTPLGRRSVLLLGVGMAGRALGQPSAAEPFPTRPVQLVVPFTPGGPADLAARALSTDLGTALGRPIVVENRSGAAGMLGSRFVSQAAPDGHTLLLSIPSSQITAPMMSEAPAYDGARDFTAIGQFATIGTVLVANPSLPAGSVQDLVAYVRARPGRINYGSPGIGSNPHLLGELLNKETGLQLVHVPYRGGSAAVQALLRDEVQLYFDALASALPWIRQGKLRAVGVVSQHRSSLLPEVPSLVEEKVLKAPADFWMGLAGPPRLPVEIVQRLNQALATATRQPRMQQFLSQGAGDVVLGTPEALQALWLSDQRRWAELIKVNHIRAS